MIAGRLPSKNPVSLMTTTSASSRSRCSGIHASRLAEPYSSSPSNTKVRFTAGARPTARSASSAVRCITSWPLSSDDAAADEPAVADERLERRVLPQVERVDRLDVVVAVDDDRRRARRLVDPAVDDRMQVGRDDLDLGRAEAAQASGDPLGGRDHVAGVLVERGHARDARELEQRLDARPRATPRAPPRRRGRSERSRGRCWSRSSGSWTVVAGGLSIVARHGTRPGDARGRRDDRTVEGRTGGPPFVSGAWRWVSPVRPAAATGSGPARWDRTTCRRRCLAR